jgi:phage major head subunit gpT-like protein
MIINQAALTQLFTAFKTHFNMGYGGVVSNIEAVITPIPMTTRAIRLVGIKEFSFMREWVGPRQHKNLEAYGFTVEARKYEDTVDVERDDIEDDNYGQYGNMFQALGVGAADLDGRLVAEILEGTHAQLGYDGLALGAATHEMGSTTYDNLSTNVLNRANLKTAANWFGSLKDDAGKKLPISPTHLITCDTGSANDMANELLTSPTLVEGGVMVANDQKGRFQHLKLPHISSATWWALACLNRPYRPVLFLPRTKAELTSVNKPEDPQVFELDKYSYGVRRRVNVAPGPWQTIYISTGTGL